MSWRDSIDYAIRYIRQQEESQNVGLSMTKEEFRQTVKADTLAYMQSRFNGEDSVAFRKWSSLVSQIDQYGRTTSGNKVEVLEEGDVCLPRMLEVIEAADTRVWLESYIFDTSEIAERFVEAVIRAKRRGCDVCVILDYCGARPAAEAYSERLRDNGIDIVVFNHMMPYDPYIGPPCFRDHRKVLVCDNRAFIGSMNIHEGTVSGALGGSGHFYDLSVEVEGPAVKDIADIFRDTLTTSGTGISRAPIAAPPRKEEDMLVQVLMSNVPHGRFGLQRTIRRLIMGADESILIATSYFMPPSFLKRSMFRSFKRGVRGTLLLSGDSDFWPVPIDLICQNHAVKPFVGQENVDVFMYDEKHMHAKYTVVDRVYSLVGSFNFDRYSSRRNLECGIGVFSPVFADALSSTHRKMCASSRLELPSSWYYTNLFARFVSWGFYQGMKWSSKNIVDGFDSFDETWHMRRKMLSKVLEENASVTIATGMIPGIH